MELIRVTPENLEKEHICCAISNNRDCQVASKKAWLSERFADGLVFLKGDVRGKCFIEYIPAEAAWAPVDAPDYLYIDCFWVSGQFKGQGNANLLLDACIADARKQGKRGLVVLSAKKKMPFLSDPGFLKHKGFTLADSVAPFYELYALRFDPAAPLPSFRPGCKQPAAMPSGFVLYYNDQCPFTARYVPLLIAQAAQRHAPFTAVHLQSAAEAQASPAPFTAFSLFYNGAFVTHEIMNESRFDRVLTEKGFAPA